MHTETIVKAASKIAKKLKADALLILTETGESFEFVDGVDIPVIAATTSDETFNLLKSKKKKGVHAIKLMTRGMPREGQIEDAIAASMKGGIIHDDNTVIIVGSTLSKEADSVIVYRVDEEKLDSAIYGVIKDSKVKDDAFEAVVDIALSIGKEGREGRLIGTAFLVGDSVNVLLNSTQLILNPFEGHTIEDRQITSPRISETVKELAQLEGVFVISSEGVIEAAGRYLDIDTNKVDIPRGFGTRHAAVAAMTVATDAIGIAVSQSGGIVRIFKDGEVVLRIEPQRRISFKTDSTKQ
jgi:DNA integrity scanning protein DisA with diadenylate cyclase activity